MQKYFINMFELAKSGNAEGILFFIAAYAFVMCMYSLWYQIRVSTWPSVVGQLLENSTSKFGHSTIQQSYTANALYTYTVDGQEYTGKRVSAWVVTSNTKFVLDQQRKHIEIIANDRVKIYYNPRNPAKSFLIVPGMFSKLFTFSIAVLPAILFYMKYH